MGSRRKCFRSPGPPNGRTFLGMAAKFRELMKWAESSFPEND